MFSKFFIENMNAIQLKVYIDAYSTTNPLGDEKRDYKLEGIYFKINNLEHALLSKDYITQLVFLISDKLVKKYGYERLLEPFIDDLIVLETLGLTINNINIKATICYMVTDNLGANSIFGLVESFGIFTEGKKLIISKYY